MGERVTDPVVLADIEAELMQAVYEAVRRARRQIWGQEEPPVASIEAQVLWQRARPDQHGLGWLLEAPR